MVSLWFPWIWLAPPPLRLLIATVRAALRTQRPYDIETLPSEKRLQRSCDSNPPLTCRGAAIQIASRPGTNFSNEAGTIRQRSNGGNPGGMRSASRGVAARRDSSDQDSVRHGHGFHPRRPIHHGGKRRPYRREAGA